jgi:hypothetical protein
MSSIYYLTVGVVIACAVVPLLFILVYWLSARWWTSDTGWRTVLLRAALALAFTLTLANHYGWLRSFSVIALLITQLLVFTFILSALCWDLWVLLKRQVIPVIRSRRKENRAPTQR